ncbi:MAG TPA: GNAT family N-acetyltransferase [Kofleriaceae bacterium]
MTPGLPDLPRWIEAHGIAAEPASWRRGLGGGFAVGSDAARLIVVAGDPDPAQLAALAAAYPGYPLLAERDELARATGRPCARIVLHALPGDDPSRALDDAVPELEGATRLAGDAELAHLPPALADELHRAAGPIWTAYVDGLPVSFAYAPWRSPRWFEVSVDTLPPARQLGLGRLVAAALIRDELSRGRAPVWGADEDNQASLRLARSLGFVAVDALWLAVPG